MAMQTKDEIGVTSETQRTDELHKAIDNALQNFAHVHSVIIHFDKLLSPLNLIIGEFFMTSAIKKMGLVVAAAGLLGSVNVLANSPISYNYAGVQFVNQDVDDHDCNQDGLRVKGSLALNSDFFALGSFSDLSGGHCGSDAISVGIGYHTLFGADSSLYGALSVENIDVDYNGESDSGLIAAVGLRGFINQQVEAKIELAHHTAFDGNTVLNGGIAYWFARNFAATADIGLGSEASEIAIGVRMNF